jgi:hypothetical protein
MKHPLTLFPFDIFVANSVFVSTLERFDWIVPLTAMAMVVAVGLYLWDGGDLSHLRPTSVSPPVRRYHRRSDEASPYPPLHLHSHCHGRLPLLFLSV